MYAFTYPSGPIFAGTIHPKKVDPRHEILVGGEDDDLLEVLRHHVARKPSHEEEAKNDDAREPVHGRFPFL